MSRKWMIVASALAVIAAVGLWLRGRSQPMVVPRPPLSKVPGSERSAVRPVIVRPSSAAPKPKADVSGTVEICGVRVPPGTRDPVAAYQLVGALAQKSAERWLARLMDSDDLRARAAGLFMDGKISDGSTVRPMAEQTRDELVQLATGAGDPAVYAMAMNACNTYSGDASGACQRLSLDQWARMDPDNAVPWLVIAGKARATHDARAEAEAFGKAARAHKSDRYNDSLLGFAAAEQPADISPLEQWYFAMEAIGIESATGLPEYMAALNHCSIEAMQDSKAKEECNALAELMVAKGTTLVDLGLGMKIGARAGWPTARIDALTQQRKALSYAAAQSAPTGNGDLWTCRGVDLGIRYVQRRLQLGEVGAATDALERSGETLQQSAQKWDEYVKTPQSDALKAVTETPAAASPAP
jgi:hypothetical protein